MEHMISPKQIKAARALAGWDQKTLAERTGLTQASIANIELEKQRPNLSTIDRIQETLEQAGVQFIADGARLSYEYVKFIEGADCYPRLLDDVYYTLKDTKGEVLFSCIDNSLSDDAVIKAVRRLREAGIPMRCLIAEGNDFILGDLEEYRQIPPKYFSDFIGVTYADKYALLKRIKRKEDPRGEFRVHLFRDSNLARNQAMLFDLVWEKGVKPKRTSATVSY